MNDLAGNLNINYTKKFNDSNSVEFSNRLNFNNDKSNLVSSSVYNNLTTESNTSNMELSSQLDNEFSLKGGVQCEAGAKFIFRNYYLKPFYNGLPGDTFLFHQKAGSLYFSASKQIKKIYLRSGLRAEATGNSFDSNSYNYITLLPNLLLSVKASELYTLNISAKRKVSRPGFYLLNNFINQNTPLKTTRGNPALTNETYTTTAIENEFSIGNSNSSFSVEYTHGSNLVSSQSFVDSFITATTYVNISKSDDLSAYCSFSKPLFSNTFFLFTSGSIGLYSISGGLQKNSGITKSANAGFSYNPSDKWSFDFNSSFIQNDIYLQGSVGNSIFTDLTVRYANKKSSWLLQATNPFFEKINESLKGSGPGFSYAGKDYYKSRFIGIAYSYIFGKQKDVRAKTHNIKNNDIITDDKL